MRFGRILLASLTALAAYSYAQTTPVVRQYDAFPRFLQAVAPLFAGASEASVNPPIAKTDAHAWLALDALTATPLAGSLILVASAVAIDLLSRRHQRTLLRC
jgi:hypothetical protein